VYPTRVVVVVVDAAWELKTKETAARGGFDVRRLEVGPVVVIGNLGTL
jgi:hypothetical protein